MPSFADLHIEFLFTVLNGLFGGRLAPGGRGPGHCYIISGVGLTQVLYNVTWGGDVENWHFLLYNMWTAPNLFICNVKMGHNKNEVSKSFGH